MSTPEDFYAFAIRQIKRSRTLRNEPWPPSLMIELARVTGIEFQDERNTGPVFRQLQLDGYIKRAGLFPRESSNGSLRPGWVGV
jgi:hypothetical protein